jgi:hypothetical protein
MLSKEGGKTSPGQLFHSWVSHLCNLPGPAAWNFSFRSEIRLAEDRRHDAIVPCCCPRWPSA